VQIDRHWTLLKSLPDHRAQRTTEELWKIVKSKGHEVSKRTVERDLEQLAMYFSIGQRTEGRTNYWYWESSAKMWIPGLTDDEALTLYMAERNLRTLLPEGSMENLAPYFAAAKERLESQPKSIRPWTKKFRLIREGIFRVQPSIPPAVLREVRDALLRDSRLTFSVWEFVGDPATSILVNPLALIQHGDTLYLIFTRAGSQYPEHIRLIDIETASISMSKFDGPENFDPDTYIKTGALTARDDLPITVGDWIEFSGLFSSHIGELVNRTSLSVNHWCFPEGDKHVRIKATVRFTSELVDWLLSLGPDVQVSQPTSLRRYIADRVTRAASLYAGEEISEIPQITKRWFEDWKSLHLKCNNCGWKGSVAKSAVDTSDESSTPASEYRCPKCSHLLLVVDFSASQEEMLSNWNTLSSAAKRAILSQPDRLEQIEYDKLKSPSELPDLKSSLNYLTWKLNWGRDGEVTYSLWHGIKFIWVQLAEWGGYSEFVRIAEIIRERYVGHIVDLKPTPEALGFLIGNNPEGKQAIDRARRMLKKPERKN
jgi:predicted DNA-binding transcriptional regulator YafY